MAIRVKYLVLGWNCYLQCHFFWFNNFVKSSYDELCNPNLANRVTNDQFENYKNLFVAYETNFRKHCKKTKPFLLEGNFASPQAWRTLTLTCNCKTTYCITFQREAIKFFTMFQYPVEPNYLLLKTHSTLSQVSEVAGDHFNHNQVTKSLIWDKGFRIPTRNIRYRLIETVFSFPHCMDYNSCSSYKKSAHLQKTRIYNMKAKVKFHTSATSWHFVAWSHGTKQHTSETPFHIYLSGG